MGSEMCIRDRISITRVVPEEAEDEGLSGGQIAGIVIGVVVGVLLLVVIIILLVYCLWKRRMSGRYAC